MVIACVGWAGTGMPHRITNQERYGFALAANFHKAFQLAFVDSKLLKEDCFLFFFFSPTLPLTQPPDSHQLPVTIVNSVHFQLLFSLFVVEALRAC